MADIEKLDLSMAGERCDDAVLPCPFCGSKNIAYGKYEHTAGRRYAIVCMNCMAQIDPGWAQSWGAVQEMWNRRAQPTNEPLTLEQSTNADRIRGMSDDEMAVWLVGATVCERVCDEDEYCHGNECVKRVTRWLKQPAKEEHNETDRC